MRFKRIALLCLLWLISAQTFAQTGTERFWLAGRYDGNRVVIYFDEVKFGNTFPSDAGIIPYPVADGFFDPMVLKREYVTRFQQRRDAVHFAIGDVYDLLIGNGDVVTVKLTTLVGFAADEAVGNSFIGALGTTDQPERLINSKNYYAVRRHVEAASSAKAGLDSEPVTFDIESKIAALVNERMKSLVPETRRRLIANPSPALNVQRFTLADGSTRYYVRADWRDTNNESVVGLAAWLTSAPALRIVAVDPLDYMERQTLLNVVDLGNGRTGLIISIDGQDIRATLLAEYKDGAGIKNMHVLHSVRIAE